MNLSSATLGWIAARALTLDERAGRSDLRRLPTPLDSIGQRLERWRHNCVRGDAQAFVQRLRHYGIAPEAIGQLLQDAALYDDAVLPPWSTFLRDALATSATWDETTIFRQDHPGDDPPFYPLLRPFVEHACALLEQRLAEGRIGPAPGSLAGPRAVLVRLLTRHAAPALHLEFTIFKAARESRLDALLRRTGPSGSRHWLRAYVLRFYRGGWTDFLVEYAVLARQLAGASLNWVTANVEMLGRLAEDKALLSAQFAGGAALGELCNIDTGISDRHNGGRATAILHFSSGIRIVYKPKPLDTDLLMASLTRWVPRSDALLDMMSVPTLNRGNYGWQAFVQHAPCVDGDAVARFYRRSGQQLALLYVLDSYDFHHENIIAAGEYPCLIDTETLQNPYREMTAVTEGETNAGILASKEVFYSVMRTGLLPIWSVGKAGGKRDASGLGGGAVAANDQHVSSRWVDCNTDDIRQETRSFDLETLANLPFIQAGVMEPADGHVAAIASGFGAMYRFILAHQDALLDIIAGHSAIPVRFVRRPTRLYLQQMENLARPVFLRDGVDWSIEAEKLGHALLAEQRENPAAWRLLQAESQALMALDVPYFMVPAHRCDVMDGNGTVVVPDYFSLSCTARLAQKLQELDVSDQLLQERYIAYAFYARAAHGYHEGNAAGMPLKASTAHLAPATARECIEVAEEIARELLAEALRAPDGSTAWIALEYIKEVDAFQLKPISCNFYSGGIGLAFFFAALAQVTENAAYRRAAESAAQPVLAALAREPDGFPGIGGIGGGVGLGSILYAVAAIIAFDASSAFSQAALTVALASLDKIDAGLLDQDHALDLIFGSAGLLLGLVKLSRVTAAPAVAAKIRLVADHLLAQRTRQDDGLWLVPTLERRVVTGLSHGTAGIALALTRAFAVTGDERYRQAAAEHVLWEEACYDHAAGNYPDYRSRYGQSSFMTCWCHGAPGIGLSRLSMHGVTGDAALLPQIERDMGQTAAFTLEHLDHLCCGNMGRIDIQLEFARQCDDAALLHRLEQDTAYILDRYRRNGGFRMFINSPNKVFSPGLFVGATGIAYGLLRMADPDGLPCVLAYA